MNDILSQGFDEQAHEEPFLRQIDPELYDALNDYLRNNHKVLELLTPDSERLETGITKESTLKVIKRLANK